MPDVERFDAKENLSIDKTLSESSLKAVFQAIEKWPRVNFFKLPVLKLFNCISDVGLAADLRIFFTFFFYYLSICSFDQTPESVDDQVLARPARGTSTWFSNS